MTDHETRTDTGSDTHSPEQCVECGGRIGADGEPTTLGPMCGPCIDTFVDAGQTGILDHDANK